MPGQISTLDLSQARGEGRGFSPCRALDTLSVTGLREWVEPRLESWFERLVIMAIARSPG